MYVCVDFDGTIVDHRYPEIGAPVPEAIPTLTEAHRRGAKLILHTMRDGDELAQALDYLHGAGISLFGANSNPDQHKWTKSPKVYGHCYIDDAALGVPLIRPEGFARPCVDWKKVGPMLIRKLVMRLP